MHEMSDPRCKCRYCSWEMNMCTARRIITRACLPRIIARANYNLFLSVILIPQIGVMLLNGPPAPPD